MGGYVAFRIDDYQLQLFEEKMGRYKGDTEEAINDVLKTRASKLVVQNILRLMPMSDLQGKKHAKQSNSIQVVNWNLGVSFYEKKGFEYLVFPELGETQFAGRKWQRPFFFVDGMEDSKNQIIEWLMQALENI